MALTLLKITQITGEHEGKLNLVIFTAVIKNKQSWYLGISVLKEERTPRPKGMKDDNCAECHEVWGYHSRTASRAVEQGVQRERREVSQTWSPQDLSKWTWDRNGETANRRRWRR